MFRVTDYLCKRIDPFRSFKIISFVLLLGLFACGGVAKPGGMRLDTPKRAGEAQATPTEAQVPVLGSSTPTMTAATATVAATSTSIATATQLPTATRLVESFSITATVWITNPYIPVMGFHQFFDSDIEAESTATKLRLSDFRTYLQGLYDSGYSLVSLEKWLEGDLHAPAGRRPIIFTIDDLFFNNQILLTADGQPSANTGIGALWEFSQEHPGFGFSLALFANLGDKLYADPGKPDWENKLANAIAWCIDHDAIVYNHFYTHPRLDLSSAREITWEAQMNDQYLRKLLVKAGRSDLIDLLDNMFALPFGLWPASKSGKKALLEYKTPEGKPLRAVFEIDTIYGAKYMPPLYAKDFDRYHLPRIVAGPIGLQTMIDIKDRFLVAQSCLIGGLDPRKAGDPTYLSGKIQEIVSAGKCPQGIYALAGMVVRASAGGVKQLFP